MPGTKTEPKYLGPMTAVGVTDSHVLVQKENSKYKKVPLHISRKYYPRSETKVTKRKSPDLPTDVTAKKFKV